MTTEDALFCLLRNEICGVPLPDDFNLTDQIEGIYRLSKRHDIVHLIGDAICRNNLLPESKFLNAFKLQMMMAVGRYEQQNAEFKRICEALEIAEISYIPLKGSVIREYYPKPWMRTSCDIDILVKAENLSAAVNHLVKTLNYQKGIEGSHDIVLTSLSGIHIELHYDTIEVGYAQKSSEVLKNVWDYAYKSEGYMYRFNDEMFYFYHIAHMAKHIENGGCGIRPFIDLFILCKSIGHTESDLIKRAGLLKFEKLCIDLTEYWFNNGNSYADLLLFREYILTGGVYGNATNNILINQQKSGGNGKFILSKIFVPYYILKFKYPILKKYKILLPIMEVRRWLDALFHGRIKTRVKELEAAKSISTQRTEDIKKLFKALDL